MNQKMIQALIQAIVLMKIRKNFLIVILMNYLIILHLLKKKHHKLKFELILIYLHMYSKWKKILKL
jgi:hypothetical protein